jgi:hypothetical protein
MYYLIMQLKLLEKQEETKPKTSRREIIKKRAAINEIGTHTHTYTYTHTHTQRNYIKNQQNKKLVL